MCPFFYRMRAPLALMLLLSFWGSGKLLLAQTGEGARIEIINANSLEYDERLGIDAKRLIGEVIFKHEGALMYADSAYFFDGKNSLDAFGNVHINQGDTVHLYGDFLKYDGNLRKAVVTGKNLRLMDKEMTLYTTKLEYETSTNQAWYNQSGRIVNGKNVLTSKKGRYYSRSKDFYFSDDVKLVNPDYTMTCDTLRHNTGTEISYFLGPTHMKGKKETMYCERGKYDSKKQQSLMTKNAWLSRDGQSIKGDTVYYDDQLGFGRADGHVEMRDSSEKVNISGRKAMYYRAQDSTVVTRDVLMEQFFKTDTLFLHADTLISVADTAKVKKKMAEKIIDNPKDSIFLSQESSDTLRGIKPAPKDSTNRRIRAFHKVKIFKSDFQGLCDSLVYDGKDSLMRLFITPVLWNEKNQLSAKHITLTIANGEISGLHMYDNCYIVSQEDSSRFNQVKGKNMIGYFIKGELKKIDVLGNGQTLYYIRDDDKKYVGANRADCTNMTIFMGEDKVDKITFYQQPDATMYPLKDLPTVDARLKDFHWLGAFRPSGRADVFQWRELPESYRTYQEIKSAPPPRKSKNKRK